MEYLFEPVNVTLHVYKDSVNCTFVIKWTSREFAYNDIKVSIGEVRNKKVDSQYTHIDLNYNRLLMNHLDSQGKLTLDLQVSVNQSPLTYHLKTEKRVFYPSHSESTNVPLPRVTPLNRELPVIFELKDSYGKNKISPQKRQHGTFEHKKWSRDNQEKRQRETQETGSPEVRPDEFKDFVHHQDKGPLTQQPPSPGLDSLNKLESTLRNKIEFLKSQLQQKDNIYNNLLSQHEELKNFNTQLQDKLKEARASSNKLAQNDGFVQALKAKNAEMKNDISNLKGDNDKLKENLRTQENTIADKDKENKRLQEIHSGNKETIQQFENDLEKYKKNIEQSQKDKEIIETDLQQSQQQNAELKTQLQKYQKFDAVKDKLPSLIETAQELQALQPILENKLLADLEKIEKQTVSPTLCLLNLLSWYMHYTFKEDKKDDKTKLEKMAETFPNQESWINLQKFFNDVLQDLEMNFKQAKKEDVQNVLQQTLNGYIEKRSRLFSTLQAYQENLIKHATRTVNKVDQLECIYLFIRPYTQLKQSLGNHVTETTLIAAAADKP